jgi:hypothetical protein
LSGAHVPAQINASDVIERLHDLPKENYLFLGNVVKGVALSIATLVLLQIASDLRQEWPRLLPCLASMAALLVTHLTWSRGVVLTNSEMNILDSIFPLAAGIVEFMLFGVLLDNKEHPRFWFNWPACVGLHALFGGAIAWNRHRVVALDRDFSPELKALGKLYTEMIARNRIGASLAGGFAFLFWGVQRWYLCVEPNPALNCGITVSIFAAVYMVVYVKIILTANADRRKIDAYVSRLPANLTREQS